MAELLSAPQFEQGWKKQQQIYSVMHSQHSCPVWFELGLLLVPQVTLQIILLMWTQLAAAKAALSYEQAQPSAATGWFTSYR